MMPYDVLMAEVLHSLARARALDGIPIVRDLYEDEVDQASRGLTWLFCHPDHVVGRIPADVSSEINVRYEAVWPQVAASNHTDGI